LTNKFVSGFASVSGQRRSIQFLTNLLQSKAIPHALLFTGNEGVGKNEIALIFAAACNCTRRSPDYLSGGQKGSDHPMIEPCGHCKSCRKIKSCNHPDVIQITPDNHTIKIDQIRSICRTLAMKPYEAKLRVVIIFDAQTMNTASANALLKVLEEPSEQTIFILIATQLSVLLPTIVSRCQHFHFRPFSRNEIAAMLIQKHNLNEQDANIMANMSNGSYSRALAMNNDHRINYRRWILHIMESLSSKTIGSRLALAEKLSKNKDLLGYALRIILSYLRDIVIWKFRPEKIINSDIKQSISAASQHVHINSTLAKIRAIQKVQQNIDSNIKLRLALEILILEL
jgi:DNA polymerase III subunit delta'